MSVEAISGAIYQDTAKVTAKPRVETSTGQGINAASINVTELPGASKVAITNSTEKEQNNGQNNRQKDGAPSEQQIKDAISKANNQLKAHRTRCEFSYHEASKRVSIKVLDDETQEVIREIPPEQTLEMVEKMWEMAGLLVDEKR